MRSVLRADDQPLSAELIECSAGRLHALKEFFDPIELRLIGLRQQAGSQAALRHDCLYTFRLIHGRVFRHAFVQMFRRELPRLRLRLLLLHRRLHWRLLRRLLHHSGRRACGRHCHGRGACWRGAGACRYPATKRACRLYEPGGIGRRTIFKCQGKSHVWFPFGVATFTMLNKLPDKFNRRRIHCSNAINLRN